MKAKALFKLLMPLFIFAAAQPLRGQGEQIPMPAMMLLPWQTPTIDLDELRKTDKERDAITLQLKNTFLPDGKPLDTLAPKSKQWESGRYLLKEVWATATPASKGRTLAIMPLWTHFHDYDLFALIVIDSTANTILAIKHRVVPQTLWQAAIRQNSLSTFFEPAFAELRRALNLDDIKPSNEDMAVSFRDQTVSTRSNEISRHALNLLLAEQWPREFTIINPLATELLTTIQSFYGIRGSMRKANRELISRLIYDKSTARQKLPVTVQMQIEGVDGVFGKTLPWSWSEPLSIAAKPADSTVKLEMSDRLLKTLLTEKESLRRDELPQVIKIRGAWAYVDKGRAWGLQMNDRLVGQESPGKIKGHVVAYYGPEMKLKSLRGWPVHEGAVIFIRKGQREVKIGQTFQYDSMTVPTPWPPSAPAP